MNIKNRMIIIGLDGVPYSLLKDLSEKGVMPNTNTIIKNGVFKQMASSIPEISPVAWSSLITGNNPAEHGIFGFTDFDQGTYKISYPNYNNLQKPSLWDTSQSRSIIINVPSTYPAKELNGVHISGFVSMDLDSAVYPKSLLPKLKEFDYRTDVDSSKAHTSIDLFLHDLDMTLNSRIDAFRFLWEYENWQTFMIVFTETDRLFHFLWDAYEDENHIFRNQFLAVFRNIDNIIGEILGNIWHNDLLIILSDHGFERLDKDIYINHLLEREGFLNTHGLKDSDLTNIDYSTLAFALDPARIYVNLQGKYPCGSVQESNRDGVIQDLHDLFKSFEHEGKPVIKDVFRKEEIYHGPLLERAPDLVLVGNEGFNLKAKITSPSLANKDIFTGKHSHHNAFLLINDATWAQLIPDNLTLFDVFRIIRDGFLMY